MRKVLTLVMGFALGLPLLSGCHLFNKVSNNGNSSIAPPPNPDQKPTTTSLVNYLNQNSKRLQSVKGNLEIDAKMGTQSISVSGAVVARRPRDMRIRARLLGQPAVDVGSNEKEFWYWIGKTKEDYYYRCSYPDLATGKVNVPFPVEVDMVMAALNMAEYDAKGKYELNQVKDTWELVQDVTSASGQPVKRTTVFRGTLARPGEPQVLEHSMRDARNGLICRATIQKVENDRASGAVIPTRLVIEYPAQKVRMTMMLSGLSVNQINDGEAARAFSIDGVGKDVFDLARNAVVTPSSHRRADNDKRR